MSSPDVLDGLTERQAEAVTHVDGPLLVLAGAGSGKTRTITRRAMYLVARGVPPSRIVAITFTNKAAGEMRERIAAEIDPRGMVVSTFHSFCVRILRQYAPLAGIEPSFSIFDQPDQTKAIKEAIKRAELAADHFSPGAVQAKIGRAKNALQTPKDFAEATTDFFDKTVARVYAHYEAYMRESNALDFDDLLLLTAILLRDDRRVRDTLEDRFGYVLIDEYQDTNRAQYLIARSLTTQHKNICATGDPDQSIYGWRGADISNILDFEKDYPDCRVVRLEQNFRSTKAILHVADTLIAANRFRKPKSLWTENPQGSAVKMFVADDAEAEAHEVARRIRNYLDAGRQPADVGIFYRVNAMSRAIESALRDHKIPYQIARGVEFYNRKEIRDVLAYLRILVNPADAVALERIINVPTRGIGQTSVGRLLAFARQAGLTPVEALDRVTEAPQLRRAAKKIGAFADLVARLGSKVDGPTADLIEYVLDESKLERQLEQTSDPDNDRLANVGELISVAATYDEEAEDPTLIGFLQEVALVSDVDAVDPEAGAVTLMTLHAAKGLEFPAVFIVGLEDDVLPHIRSQDDDRSVEEERRLFFVGITRAKQELTLSQARRRMTRGMTIFTRESPFLRDLPADGLDIDEDPVANPNADVFGSRRFDGRRSIPIDEWGTGRSDAYDDDYSQLPEDELIEKLDRVTRTRPSRDPRLHVGQRVRHKAFGVGEIEEAAPQGKRTRVAVRFERVGVKRLVVPPANLEPVE